MDNVVITEDSKNCVLSIVFENGNKITIEDDYFDIDVLIDGKFILEEKSLNTKFRGSKNQRIIDVKNSLLQNEVILIKKYEEKEEFVFNNKYLFV